MTDRFAMREHERLTGRSAGLLASPRCNARHGVHPPACAGGCWPACARLHVGKLPPAIPVLRDALGVTLLQAGFLLSLVQLAGMTLGLAVGAGCGQVRPAPQHAGGTEDAGLASAAGRLGAGSGRAAGVARPGRSGFPAGCAACARLIAPAGATWADERAGAGLVGRLHAVWHGAGVAGGPL